MRWIIVIALLAACGSTGPSLSLTGSWSYTSSVSNSQLSTSCQSTGTANLSQSGSTFSGSYSASTTCTGPGGISTATDQGTYGGGQVNGSAVSFQGGGCSYTGSATSNAMNGAVSCTVALSGQNYTFSGTWSAQR